LLCKNPTEIGFLYGMISMRFVAYLRVSTDRQGRSGLGLDAQRKAVQDFIAARAGELVAEYVEVESGKVNERPQLAQAMAEAKRTGATLLIAKLDRLARNVAFIANLLEGGVEVAAADLPDANRFVLHIMAALAEEEGRMISGRTRAALAAAKAKGTLLGWAIPTRRDKAREASLQGVRATVAAADRHAANVLPVIREVRERGASLHQIAAELNERGLKTARGGRWYATTVRNVLARSTVI